MKLLFSPLLLVTSLAWGAAPALTDAQIAHIAYTAGRIDIEAAQLAIERSASPEVKAFAETMLRDHTAVNEQALALVRKLGVTPETNPTSEALADAAAKALERQRTLSGAAFDLAYVSNEVAYHAQVNEALRSALIPGSRNAELRALLESGLALFSSHQEHAETLERDLAAP